MLEGVSDGNHSPTWPGGAWSACRRPVPAGVPAAAHGVHRGPDPVRTRQVIAGVVVALLPRYGALLVAAWLAGIIVNLLLIPGYYDIALRDFGLLIAALALNRLAVAHDGRGPR